MFNAASDQIQSNIPSFQSRYNYSDDDSSTTSCSVSSASVSVAIEDGESPTVSPFDFQLTSVRAF